MRNYQKVCGYTLRHPAPSYTLSTVVSHSDTKVLMECNNPEMKKREMEQTCSTECDEGLRMLSHSVGMLTADWQT